MSTIPDPFRSSKRSLARAEHHISDLIRETAEFFKTQPFTNVVEDEPNRGSRAYKVKLVKRMPDALDTIAADAVNNLRSALDQACFAVRPAGKDRNIYFPFAKNAAQFETAVKGRCEGLPTEIVDLIRGFKPYKGGDNLLWALNELCNTNKHGILAPVAVSTSVVRVKEVNIYRGHSSGGFEMLTPVWDRTKGEMTFFRCDRRSTVEASVDMSAHLILCDVEPVDGLPAEAVLKEFLHRVKSIVTEIEAESKRIGLF